MSSNSAPSPAERSLVYSFPKFADEAVVIQSRKGHREKAATQTFDETSRGWSLWTRSWRFNGPSNASMVLCRCRCADEEGNHPRSKLRFSCFLLSAFEVPLLLFFVSLFLFRNNQGCRSWLDHNPWSRHNLKAERLDNEEPQTRQAFPRGPQNIGLQGM